ncbi:MAG: hypothetical protein D6702_00250 [Planctomycetota bacterium]|nr:MAG: hypothetical protein D6702_00250 [Planctomycetota bacterium]
MLAALLLALSAPAFPQQEIASGDLVFSGVRLWSATEGPGEPVTVVVRDGRLEVVADADAGLALAPAATLVEAEEDWILYPGLVHAAFPAELEEPEASPYAERAADPRQGPIPEMEYGDHRSLRTSLLAADHLRWDPAAGEDWRGRGFTAVQVLPGRGVVRGRAALLSLNGEPLGDALLERRGRLCFALRGAGGYPATPMAGLAFLRQAFLDARRLAEGRAGRFQEPDLDGLEPGIFLADSPREIENVLDLLRDFAEGGRGAVILGGHGADRHVERLRAQGVGVLYRLRLDRPIPDDEQLGRRPETERPWWQEPAARLAERRRLEAERVSEFRRLREAGVACALVPVGGPGELASALARLEEDGLSTDALYDALGPAVWRVLGLDPDRFAADFVISRGPFDFADPRPAWVVAGGRAWKWTDEDRERPAEREESDADRAATLAGEWSADLDTPMGSFSFGVELDPAHGRARVFAEDAPGDRQDAREVRFTGDSVRFTFTPPEPAVPMTMEIRARGGGAEGSLDTPFGKLPVRLERRPGSERPAAPEPPAAAEPSPDLGHPEWPVETPADRVPTHDFSGSVLLRGGTLWTMTGEEPFVGDLLIVDGRIEAVGPNLAAPEGVPVFAAEGLHLMPGIIDPHSHLALDAINEGTVAISAECRVGDMLHPEEVGIWRAAAGGTAVAQALHGSANPIGGQAAIWELDVRRPAIADLLLPGAPRQIKFALGENVKRSNGNSWGQRFPGSRAGVQALYRRAFAAAADYARRRAAFARGGLPSFRRDLRLETLAGVLAGDIRIQCHGYRADELLMFLRLCQDLGIRPPVFQHALESYKVAPELAAAGAMVSTFADWWAYKLEVIDAIPWNPALTLEAGTVTSIHSDSDEMIRRLNAEAGKSLRYGRLDWQQAMSLCTTGPAEQLGLGDRLGRLAPGYDGTVSVFDAPPLSSRACCVLTLARGRTLFERPAELEERWRRYREAAAAFALTRRRAEGGDPAPRPPAPVAADWEPWIRAGRGSATLIRNAVVHPVSAPPFLGEVLIRDGRFAFVGRRWPEEVPPGCVEIDAGGLHLYPGFLNAGDVTGVWEIGSLRASRDDAETGEDQPDLSLATAVHADSRHLRVTRMNGITHVLVRPTAGRIRGQAALIQLDGTSTEEVVVVPDLALVVAFPRAAAGEDGKAPKPPEEVAELDRWFDRALAYGELLDRLGGAEPPELRHDPRLAALLPYARGEKPVMIEAEDVWTIMAARAWAGRRGLRVIWAGARDAWKVAGFLGADRAAVIAGPVHRLPASDTDPFDAPFRLPGLLEAVGCRVALRTANPEVTRNLPFQAATAAARGWSEDAALRAITLGAAEVLGVDRYTGSIEEGKAANCFLAEGDPLDFPGVVRRMWIGGREVELTSHQTELRDRYARRIAAQRGAGGAAAGGR